MPSSTITAAPSAAESRTSTETATESEWNVRKETATAVVFWTANTAIKIENNSARKTMTCDTRLSLVTSGYRFGGSTCRTPRRCAVPRQLLRLPLVRRPWVVDAAQDASIHEVSRWLFNFTIAFFATRHWSLRSRAVSN